MELMRMQQQQPVPTECSSPNGAQKCVSSVCQRLWQQLNQPPHAPQHSNPTVCQQLWQQPDQQQQALQPNIPTILSTLSKCMPSATAASSSQCQQLRHACLWRADCLGWLYNSPVVAKERTCAASEAECHSGCWLLAPAVGANFSQDGQHLAVSFLCSMQGAALRGAYTAELLADFSHLL